MQEHFIYLTDFDIPQSASFKTAFVTVTVLYVISMVILFILYKKAASKLDSKKEKNTPSAEQKSIRNKQHKHHQH